MAIVKLASFAAVFLLAAFFMFPVKKVEADCTGDCYLHTCGSLDCTCYFSGVGLFECGTPKTSFTDIKKMVAEHSKLCWSHGECTMKGSGNYCACFPYSDIKYGLCFASISEAADMFFKTKGFSKMPVTTA